MSHTIVSVCICTLNGADRIEAVLAALGRQTDRSDAWDVIVVDNASRDRTADVARGAIDVHLGGRGRLVMEPQPGLMHARKRAAAEASGDVIAFLDDDNIAAPDYIRILAGIVRANPRAGVIGGKVAPDWIGEPDPLGVAVAGFALAMCDRGDNPFAYAEVTGGPAGAGMVVRRDLLLKIFDEADLAHRVTGRTGSALTGGEDTAIVIRAHQLGFEVRYEPALLVHHRIPADRTRKEYLLRLYEGIGRGQANMRPLFDPKARSPVLRKLIAVKEGLRCAAMRIRGPSAALRAEYGPLAPDVHDLQIRQTYGRFDQGLRA